MIFIGIDPGLHGAIAFYSHPVMDVHDLPLQARPVHRRKKQEDGTTKIVDGKRNEIDAYALSRLVRDYAAQDDCSAFMELVSARNTDSQVSAGAFLGCAREIRGVVKARMIPFTEVATIKWRNALGIRKPPAPGDKSLVIARATELFPTISHLWTGKGNKGHHDRAEACLIAYYGYCVTENIGR
jgi:hypothetical protein